MLEMKKEQQTILLALIAACFIGLLVVYFKPYLSKAEKELEIKENGSVGQGQFIYVHLSGMVKNEGVYRLSSGERLLDLLTKAGGVLPNADLSPLNLAESVKDGQKVIVPPKIPALQPGEKDQARINLNTATESELDSLPGVGRSTAREIINHRSKRGPFTSPEQLIKLPRFGKAKYERLRERVTW